MSALHDRDNRTGDVRASDLQGHEAVKKSLQISSR
jgi:hypothetical protein